MVTVRLAQGRCKNLKNKNQSPSRTQQHGEVTKVQEIHRHLLRLNLKDCVPNILCYGNTLHTATIKQDAVSYTHLDVYKRQGLEYFTIQELMEKLFDSV